MEKQHVVSFMKKLADSTEQANDQMEQFKALCKSRGM